MDINGGCIFNICLLDTCVVWDHRIQSPIRILRIIRNYPVVVIYTTKYTELYKHCTSFSQRLSILKRCLNPVAFRVRRVLRSMIAVTPYKRNSIEGNLLETYRAHIVRYRIRRIDIS